MRRLLCRLGVHGWVTQRNTDGWPAYRICWHCSDSAVL